MRDIIVHPIGSKVLDQSLWTIRFVTTNSMMIINIILKFITIALYFKIVIAKTPAEFFSAIADLCCCPRTVEWGFVTVRMKTNQYFDYGLGYNGF